MHLWSSSGSDSGLARELLAQDLLQGHLSSRQRSFFVRHFARVLNLAYAQVRRVLALYRNMMVLCKTNCILVSGHSRLGVDSQMLASSVVLLVVHGF
jgi:hypothetical protein